MRWTTLRTEPLGLSRGGRLTARGVPILVLLVMLGGCRVDMHVQPSHAPLDRSEFFADGSSARPLVPETVPRGFLREDEHLYAGRVNGQDVTEFPFTIDEAVLSRGQERFNIFCSTCHGATGRGDGMIVRRGFQAPPTFHQDRLREAPVGHFFNVATNGFGAMPDYAPLVPVHDRWAIIAYIRALQLSQHAGVEDVPGEERQQLERRPQGQ
jgi:cytochrome c5